jgi:N-ethylmaleimide reductase
MTTHPLFSPLKVGHVEAPNRIFMAPCTRCRAGADRAPHALNAEYYRQRASAGLLITEATQVCPEGIGYPGTPGIHTEKQVAGWRHVTDAVHAAGGRIYCQLWHVGRVSHAAYQPGGALPVSSSAIAKRGEIMLPDYSKAPYSTPRALERDEIQGVIQQFRNGAENALLAGFDGVELHGANGYLPDQFLRDGVNRRTDDYGGPIENRARFMLDATRALIDVWGPERVGVRLSPSGAFNDMHDSAPRDTFSYVVREMDRLRVGYLHIMEAMESDLKSGKELFPDYEPIPVSFFRPHYRGVLITNSGFTLDKARTYLKEGWADAIAFGALFIANPDLPARFRRISAGDAVGLNTPDPSTFYAGGDKGYTDYPALSA